LVWLSVSAHPGNTDSQSGHIDHKTGEYHFHTPNKQAAPKVSIQEKHWQKAFNDKVLQVFRFDLLWRVLQALEYARLTGKRPGLAIILEGEKVDTEKYQECVKVCRYMFTK
jgi:hypothetical protein